MPGDGTHRLSRGYNKKPTLSNTWDSIFWHNNSSRTKIPRNMRYPQELQSGAQKLRKVIK